MADTQSYQSKLKRLVFSSETTTGTEEELTAASFTVPAFDISLSRDRGTGLIARDGVMDGKAGELCGTTGSFGSSLSFSSELHPSAANPDVYFVRMLQACGFEGTDSGTAVTLFPSTKVIKDYAAVEPGSLTFGLIHEIAEIDDTIQTMYGSTGVASFTLNSGERAQFDCAFVGLNGAFMTFEADASLTGSVSEITCNPFVVKGITATITGTDTGDAFDEVQLSTITINTNAETPEILDPTQADGFGVSPVFFNSAPTVSFQIGATSVNNTRFWSYFKNGTPITINVTLADPASSMTLQFLLERVQFTGVSMTDNNGAESYSVEGKVVRNAGEDYNTSGSRFNIVYTY